MIDIFENNHNDVLEEIDKNVINNGAIILCKDSIKFILTYFNKDNSETYLIIAEKFKDFIYSILPENMFEKTLFMDILDNTNSNLYLINDNKYHFTSYKYQIYV